jgi:hypothetical protein
MMPPEVAAASAINDITTVAVGRANKTFTQFLKKAGKFKRSFSIAAA